MNKIKIKLENCYGINKFEKEFDFSKKSAYIIYASNGSMKTSFTKSLSDIAKRKIPKEEVFGRVSEYKVSDENGYDVSPEDIFVIESYDAEFNSKRMSNLLLNKDLQERYHEYTSEILEKKSAFIRQLETIVRGKIDVEREFMNTFDSSDFLETLQSLQKADIAKMKDSGIDFDEIQYGTLFDPKVETFASDIKNNALLVNYSKQYETLIKNSEFLKKGIFSHYNASQVNAELEANGYFEAGHTIYLNNVLCVKNHKSFAKLIADEKEKILSDPKLAEQFKQIDKRLSANVSLRNFRLVIEKKPELIAKLGNFKIFKEDSWVCILKKHIPEINELVKLYIKIKKEIKEIQKKAQEESVRWRKVVDIFTDRFFVPFSVQISNQEDVVLKGTIPTLSFKYRELKDEMPIERTKLNSILSGGERRALYLLNIIFELEALKDEGRKILVVTDDIAESFDYKNKYAIIQYLIEHYNSGIFNFIILTHNFDFYRTVGSRMLESNRNHCVMATKGENEIQIKDGQYLKNVFATWKDSFEKKDTILIASIPFIRNIIEYIDSQESDDYKLLTNMLHMCDYSTNKNTKDILLTDLEKVINNVWKTEKKISKNRISATVYSTILETANEIISAIQLDEIALENKIVLSIAIRLVAEEHMMRKVVEFSGTELEVKGIVSNQTGKLLSLYKKYVCSNKEMLSVLEEVNLMTPENIHLNSFMYEPIIDISVLQLKKLYETLKKLI